MDFMPSIHHRTRHARARGVASLAVTLIMLALAALVILYSNRGQLFEQRTSANQMRATAAFEAAEAGIEWAIARLNDNTLMQTPLPSDCGATAGTGQTFRSVYTPWTQNALDPALLTFTPPTDARAACSIDEDPTLGATTPILTCRCPTPSPNPINHPAPGRRSFEVFIDRSGIADPGMVRITSVGCRDAVASPTSTTPALCSPNSVNHQGKATVTVLVKYVPGVGSYANSAFTGASWAAFCGSFNITNANSEAGGILVNTGANTQIGQGTYSSGTVPSPCGGGGGQVMSTVPGTPISAAVVPNDPALLAAGATRDGMMKAYLGLTEAEYRTFPGCDINGTSAQDRAANLLAAASAGPCTRFWITGDLAFSGGVTLGSHDRPIVLASASDMSFSGNSFIYGIVYSDIPDWNHNGTGNMTIRGQLIVRGSHYTNGNGSIIYDDAMLRSYLPGSGVFVKVPGSWKDS